MLVDAGSVIVWWRRGRLEGRFRVLDGRLALGMGVDGGLYISEERYCYVAWLSLHLGVGAIDMVLRESQK